VRPEKDKAKNKFNVKITTQALQNIPYKLFSPPHNLAPRMFPLKIGRGLGLPLPISKGKGLGMTSSLAELL